jgi:phosphatidylglycerophosphatase A
VVGLATAGGAGFAPIAPGTFGSLVGVAAYAGVAGWGAGAVLGLAAAGLGVGIWASGEAERLFDRSDDGRIVIDEVVGQLIALAPVPLLGRPEDLRSPLLLALAFFAFRLFDIWKPGPVRTAERRLEGGLGVMLDDVLAGALTALVVAAAVLALGARG